MYPSYSELSKELKNGIEICVGQAVFNLWMKIVMMFGSITQEPLGVPIFYAIFEFLGQFTIRCILSFFQGVDKFEIEHKTC